MPQRRLQAEPWRRYATLPHTHTHTRAWVAPQRQWAQGRTPRGREAGRRLRGTRGREGGDKRVAWMVRVCSAGAVCTCTQCAAQRSAQRTPQCSTVTKRSTSPAQPTRPATRTSQQQQVGGAAADQVLAGLLGASRDAGEGHIRGVALGHSGVAGGDHSGVGSEGDAPARGVRARAGGGEGSGGGAGGGGGRGRGGAGGGGRGRLLQLRNAVKGGLGGGSKVLDEGRGHRLQWPGSSRTTRLGGGGRGWVGVDAGRAAGRRRMPRPYPGFQASPGCPWCRR